MKRLLSFVACSAILALAPQTALPGPLYDAVIAGDFQKVSGYVTRGQFETVGDLGTPLNAAIALGYTEIAVTLIDHGAGIEASRGGSAMRRCTPRRATGSGLWSRSCSPEVRRSTPATDTDEPRS